jgi:hypothetical protein
MAIRLALLGAFVAASEFADETTIFPPPAERPAVPATRATGVSTSDLMKPFQPTSGKACVQHP